MSEPGSIEKVPLKVVPMYIEAEDLEKAEQSEPPEAQPDLEDESDPIEREKTIALGALALAASVFTVIAAVAAVVIATNGEYPTSTALAYLAIGLSVVGVVGGILAVVLNRGRRLGVIAAVLGLLANPYLMLVGLEFLGGARS